MLNSYIYLELILFYFKIFSEIAFLKIIQLKKNTK